ncbi:MAG: cysteine--tRNA ligase [Prevotellaceae bacterium]|jgi:cysteinyl-tRNA synthetase|nr:cysteine--tRNA ligase [Prevotellaceae bacterium]
MTIYNTLTRQKESFEPLHPPYVGMYVCGPTVYGDPHLGHARSAISFDILFRYLLHLNYRVRYVRNITDVGHLENDSDDGEDKLLKKARLEQLEPMEVAKYYTDRYHDMMDALNVRRPSIEPTASGHIMEQIEMVQQVLDAGYAYVVNGSVYFDVAKYGAHYHYGILSGREVDKLLSATRDNLEGRDEKRHPADFALWKRAQPEHIMRWRSPWSEGFPGWHLECSAMGRKYLGEQFDIHGGGMDLQFPHHESEIAQSQIASGQPPCRYWMHNNMITVNGQKMGKSLGNSIMLEDFFTGHNPLLAQAYTPMSIRFFILQAHYRSTLDFSNEALQAAERGLRRLLEAVQTLSTLTPTPTAVAPEATGANAAAVAEIVEKVFAALDDDLNTPVAIAHLFDAVRLINAVNDKKEPLSEDAVTVLKELFDEVMVNILGLRDDRQASGQVGLLDGLIRMILDVRATAKANRDFATGDRIRDELTRLGVAVKDTKEGSVWSMVNG